MKKIIVPIDFSEYSEYALETASVIARKFDAEIIALHMLELSDAYITKGSSDLNAETAFFLKMAEKKFNEILDKNYLKDISITPIIKHFKVFSEINDVALEHGADIIIMGSHGASGIKEMFIGSNTEKVVRHSDIPVLIVKHSPILTEFETVVFACDFSEESVKSYTKAKIMFESLGIAMKVVYVNLPDNRFLSSAEMESRVAKFFKEANGNIDMIKDVAYVSDYSIEKGILNYANVVGADLITVATHGRKGLAHFFEGSISEDIANHSALPVMTFKI